MLPSGGYMFSSVDPAIGRPFISAVTGTNGKTTVATATRQLMNLVGWRAAGYDSTGITDVDGRLHEAITRPSPDYLPELIERQFRAGATSLSIEAFVGILADGLFEHVIVDTAVSTGFERDHLDAYRSINTYWAAKLRLFDEYLRADGVAVVAKNSAQVDLVRKAVKRRGAALLTVGRGGELDLTGAEERDGCLHGRLDVAGELFAVCLPTVHPVVVINLLLASGAVLAAGATPEAVAHALQHVTPPPGRLQVIAERNGITAMVDTAHNPGALRIALENIRSSTRGRVLLVFGAGGESDPGKRPIMGAIARRLADIVVLTDDNPRSELSEQIRAQVRIGVPSCIEIPRRKDAILAALQMARPGDTVLVAGKGDEEYQLVGNQRLPHDDREIIRQAMLTA